MIVCIWLCAMLVSPSMLACSEVNTKAKTSALVCHLNLGTMWDTPGCRIVRLLRSRWAWWLCQWHSLPSLPGIVIPQEPQPLSLRRSAAPFTTWMHEEFGSWLPVWCCRMVSLSLVLTVGKLHVAPHKGHSAGRERTNSAGTTSHSGRRTESCMRGWRRAKSFILTKIMTTKHDN